MRWLKEYFGFCPLPEHLAHWLQNRPDHPFYVQKDGRCLSITRIDRTRKGSLCLLLEERANGETPLTRREAEVRYWLCQGKSNEEIAQILGISQATVKKHLQRIYDN